ncbi:hypothetical protein [Streptomyces sp. NPDC006739]|uniref:hypothetical protein n=1 Tax=Streptomyces sp. NPDC006739 TaxID=3364763 RepID=UPI00369EA09E
MTELDGLDRPGTPGNPGPWDARAHGWPTAAPGRGEPAHGDEDEPPSRGASATGGRRNRGPAARRGAADPVKALLHRHRDLCRRAVDPLEIAAALEAHGLTDRTAARYRHRDVFSLAEELYARVPHDGEPRACPEPVPAPRVRADWLLLALLPGALSAAAVTGLRLTHGRPRLLVAAAAVLTLGLAVRTVLRRGPLGLPPGTRAWRTATGTRACTTWLLAYALLGDGFLRAVVNGGPDGLPSGAPDGPWPLATAPVLALTLAFAPAAWSAHLFAAGARRRLAGSRSLAEFTAAARPLLLGALALFLGALTALLALSAAALRAAAAYPEALTLGALLLLARLLTVHHVRRGPSPTLAVAALTEAAAPALALTGRLPGCAFLAAPVDTLVDTLGPGSVPTLACGTAALTLLVQATRTLTRASAHGPTGADE